MEQPLQLGEWNGGNEKRTGEKKKSWVSATLSWSVNPMLARPLTSRSRQLTRKCFLVPPRAERKREREAEKRDAGRDSSHWRSALRKQINVRPLTGRGWFEQSRCGRRVASKAESTPYTLENRCGSLTICILVSSAVVLQTPTVGSRLKSALFPNSPATFSYCIRISKARKNSVVTDKKMRANQDPFVFRVGVSRLNFRLGFP